MMVVVVLDDDEVFLCNNKVFPVDLAEDLRVIADVPQFLNFCRRHGLFASAVRGSVKATCMTS